MREYVCQQINDLPYSNVQTPGDGPDGPSPHGVRKMSDPQAAAELRVRSQSKLPHSKDAIHGRCD